MDPKPELIREDIDETRTAITEKLETLEGALRGNFETAKQTVEGTIENVKDSIRHLSPIFQTAKHPYVMVGGAIATGFVAGRLLKGKQAAPEMPWLAALRPELYVERPRASEKQRSEMVTGVMEYAVELDAKLPPPANYKTPPGRTLFNRFTEEFEEEIQLVKGMVLKGVLEAAADLMKKSAPKWSAHIDVVKDSVASKLPQGAADTNVQPNHSSHHSGL